MAGVMQNIDIKDFTTVSSVELYDHVVVSLFGGMSAKMSVGLLRSVVSKGLTPSIDENGVWHVGDENTGVQAEAKTPEFRAGELAVEWKFTYEDDSAWRTLVAYEDTRPDYDSLTPEQRDAVRLRYSDLTEDEIAELQQPASDMIEVLEATDASVKESEEKRQQAEEERKTSEAGRNEAESLRSEAEESRKEAESERESDYASLREDILKATDNANEVADLARNQPVITDGNWWVWDTEAGAYADTGTPAIGRSPKIENGTWWVWNDLSSMYLDTGIVVDKYKVTEELALSAKEESSEALKAANEAKNSVAKLEGLADADLSSVVAAEVITQVETNKSSIAALYSRDVVMSEDDYILLEREGRVDPDKFYFLYEEE